MFIQIDQTWTSAAKSYCYLHPHETLEISYYLMHRESLKRTGDKRSGRLYGYCQSDQLLGLVLFNDKGVMHISNQAEGLFDKVDFLKTIHRENPRLVRGPYRQVEQVFYFLQRALKHFKFTPTILMQAEPSDNNSVPCSQIVSASQINWQQHASFLVEVERELRDQPLTINNLRNKLKNAINLDFYTVYQQSEQPLGQIIGEFTTWQFGVIGGLYTRPKWRRRGLAKQLMRDAMDRYIRVKRTPVLYVVERNEAAIALYQQLGYTQAMRALDLVINL